MIGDRRARPGAGWLTLLALPVVRCLGHAALLALAAGSFTAGVGASTGSALAVAAGVALVAAAGIAVLLRRKRRTRRPSVSPTRDAPPASLHDHSTARER